MVILVAAAQTPLAMLREGCAGIEVLQVKNMVATKD